MSCPLVRITHGTSTCHPFAAMEVHVHTDQDAQRLSGGVSVSSSHRSMSLQHTDSMLKRTSGSPLQRIGSGLLQRSGSGLQRMGSFLKPRESPFAASEMLVIQPGSNRLYFQVRAGSWCGKSCAALKMKLPFHRPVSTVQIACTLLPVCAAACSQSMSCLQPFMLFQLSLEDTQLWPPKTRLLPSVRKPSPKAFSKLSRCLFISMATQCGCGRCVHSSGGCTPCTACTSTSARCSCSWSPRKPPGSPRSLQNPPGSPCFHTVVALQPRRLAWAA